MKSPVTMISIAIKSPGTRSITPATEFLFPRSRQISSTLLQKLKDDKATRNFVFRGIKSGLMLL